MYPGNTAFPTRNQFVKSVAEMAWMDYYVRGMGRVLVARRAQDAGRRRRGRSHHRRRQAAVTRTEVGTPLGVPAASIMSPLNRRAFLRPQARRRALALAGRTLVKRHPAPPFHPQFRDRRDRRRRLRRMDGACACGWAAVTLVDSGPGNSRATSGGEHDRSGRMRPRIYPLGGRGARPPACARGGLGQSSSSTPADRWRVSGRRSSPKQRRCSTGSASPRRDPTQRPGAPLSADEHRHGLCHVRAELAS